MIYVDRVLISFDMYDPFWVGWKVHRFDTIFFVEARDCVLNPILYSLDIA